MNDPGDSFIGMDLNEPAFPFELRIPGGRLVLDDRSDLYMILSAIQMSFADAAMALIMFEGIPAFDMATYKKRRRETRDRISEEAKQIREERVDPFSMGADEYYLATQRYARGMWADGRLPEQLMDRAQFIHAKSFIYAADTIGKLLSVLGRHPKVPAAIENASARFYDSLPTLKGLRDSAHHIEDRVRGKHRDKDLELKPVEEGGGAALIIDMLTIVSGEFGTTMADGSYGKIAVTRDTLMTIRDQVQAVLDAFDWTGAPTYFPRP